MGVHTGNGGFWIALADGVEYLAVMGVVFADSTRREDRTLYGLPSIMGPHMVNLAIDRDH